MAHLAAVPNELILGIGHNLSIRDLRSLAATCKNFQTVLNSGFLYEEEVAEERDFDNARLRLSENDPSVINFTYPEIARWPESRELKFSHNPEHDKDYFDFLDSCVYRWGAGMLYCTISTVDTTWDRNLVRQLPAIHRRGSLIHRAMTSCSDIKVIGRVIRAYSVHYPEGILGLKDTRVRRQFHGFRQNNDPVPLFRACSKGRVDILDLMRKEWADDDFNLVTDGQNISQVPYTASISEWACVNRPNLTDAWEMAFYARDRLHRREIHEDVCVWLLEHHVGFASRPGGLPISHLAEAAVHKKVHLVQAMIRYYESHVTRNKFERALARAFHAASRGWTTCEPPSPYRPGGRGPGFMVTPDGHAKIVNQLLHATSRPYETWVRQNPRRRHDRGHLARAVRCAPHNALHLLSMHVNMGLTDHRDVRAALVEAIHFGGNGDLYRFRFFKTIFPGRFQLACDPKELAFGAGHERYEREVKGLWQALRAEIRTCFYTNCFSTAVYLLRCVGREFVGEWLADDLERAQREQLAAASPVVAGLLRAAV